MLIKMQNEVPRVLWVSACDKGDSASTSEDNQDALETVKGPSIGPTGPYANRRVFAGPSGLF